MITLALTLAALMTGGEPAVSNPASFPEVVRAIQSADYRGARADLQRLVGELDQMKDPKLAAHRQYWRGFALWRRALNGFNETPMPGDLEADLKAGIASFQAALALNPDWIEARIGLVGCASPLLFLAKDDTTRREAVLKEYIRVDKELTERAKDILEIRGLPYSHLGRTKRQLAEQKEFGLGEEGLTWICNQMLEAFMSSRHIDEVFAEDAILRRKIKDICKKHMQVDEAMDQEVRDRIKNIEEGSQAWDIEYAKVLEQVKGKHGLKE